MNTHPDPRTESERRVICDVDAVGYHVTSIAERGDAPGWAYTVGLHHNHAQPEIVIVGLPIGTMESILQSLASDVAHGARYDAGTTSAGVLEDLSCAFRDVAKTWHDPFLHDATWFYGGTGFDAVQCLWPDQNNRLPDDPRFGTELAPLQPLLEHATVEAARGAKWIGAADVV